MMIHIVLLQGVAPVEAWTDKLWAMRRAAELGGGNVVTLELRSENTPETAADNATADADREPRARPGARKGSAAS
jgi:hypothetical protein